MIVTLLDAHRDTPSDILKSYYTGLLVNKVRLFGRPAVSQVDVQKFNAAMNHLKHAITLIEELETDFL
jgi:hypothetical protein